MSLYTAHINVMPLTELLDPQGKAVNDSLHKLGFQAIQGIRIGKHITLQIEAANAEEAKQVAEDACKKLLYNAVMEQYEIVIS
ncbi:MAG: phosphoribosylformylglycinamidine synthase subunit PurS [Bacteroidota bacterium]|jgi:phosphoribosylformylglycinamidine synthase